MAEEKKMNRGWVKNAAIIFLAVMLVLTFFSNTIMNRSLPEVAVQYTQSGTITASIRGTGTVTANSTYNVSVSQTRTVATVLKKVGDTVKPGDVLFTLGDSESDELKTAKDSLSALKLQYSIDLINASSAFTDDKRKIEQAQKTLTNAISDRDTYSSSSADTVAQKKAEIASLKSDIADLQKKQAATGFTGIDETSLRTQKRAIQDKEDEIHKADAAGEDTSTLETQLDRLKDDYNDMEDAAKYGEKITSAQADLTNAQADLTDVQESYTSWKTADAAVTTAQDALDDLVYALEKKQKVDGSITNLNLAASKAKIAEQQQVVNELSADSISKEILAPQAGIVTTINVKAGDTTVASTPLAVVETPDLGYSLTFSVTAAQAKKVTVGQTAEISNYYSDSDIKATLTSIKTDPANPGVNKILTFTLTGEVETGSQLSLTVGEHSADYQFIVPNSAIRTDSTGDFILIVESKSTPLGNRYIARRVDVQVLDKDDTNTAVSGGLAGYEYVITTSSAPLEPGMQVRLVEQ